MMKPLSLRARLILLISVAIFSTWFVASTVTFFQIRHSLEELFDSQQYLFAKRLASSDLQILLAEPKSVTLPKLEAKSLKKLEYDDDALAFAIFNLRGEMLINDGNNGSKLKYDANIVTSKERALLSNQGDWRILWLKSFDGRHIIAVGQELDYREDIGEQLVIGQMIPWLLLLPILVAVIIIMISRELKPLKSIAAKLMLRQPDDASTLAKEGAPKEVQPFIDALNALFARIATMLTKERRFISDAAHELRTPLAALKVQTEVAQLSDDDPESRHHALENLNTGIDRATRLVDQLLTLSRLESLSESSDIQPIDWRHLIQSVIDDLDYQITEHQATVSFIEKDSPAPYQGNVLLLSLLMRNLVDNALRYTEPGCAITIALYQRKLIFKDNGAGVSDAFLARLGERFFRPPGQDEIGSGLGLSIVKQIAAFHHIAVRFYNDKQGGFAIELNW